LKRHEIAARLLFLLDGRRLSGLRHRELGLAAGDVRQVARAIAVRVVVERALGLIERDFRLVDELGLELRCLSGLGLLVAGPRVDELARRETRPARDEKNRSPSDSP
jgi:hypothetical protein